MNGKPCAIFNAVVNIRETSHARIPPDCGRLAEKLALVAFRLFPQPLWFHATVCCGVVGEGTSMCPFKSVPTWWLWGPISACAARYSVPRVLVLLLSSLLSMLSGEIYMRLKLYLVVKISSDIVTEHCCQVCVLSMMFCRSATVCWHGDCTISRKLLGVPTWFDWTVAGQRRI